ncbi:MAG: PD-(D/E)XK nuclease family protein, partial [Eubacteriales bacterium]
AYEAQLKSALKKCEVPVFIDKRQPIITQPLITFVRSAVEIAANGFSLDAVMRYLKTGLAGFSIEDISTLENYALLWNMNGNRWLQEWTAHPGGYGNELFNEDAKLLAYLNTLRASVTKPLAKLKSSFEDADGEAVAKAIFDLLVEVNAGENLKNLAIALEENAEPVLALEQERLWDDLMTVLDNTATALKGSSLSAKHFRELFDLIIATRSLGSIPQGLDEITIGSADRIRTASPKAVFVVGANEGVFPRSPVSTGVLNDLERQKLIGLGLKVSDPGEFKVIEERFIAYTALCSASEKLFVSYSRKDLAGAGLSPSEIVSQIKHLFPNCQRRDTADIPDLDYIEGSRPAFELTAKLWRKGNELYTSLRAYFNGRDDYKDKLEALDRAVANKPFEIKNNETASELFGKNMYMSASRVESYSKCAFAYYCKYGLKAEPRGVAELDPMQKGTILHLVLQKLLEKYPGKKLIALSRQQRLTEIHLIMDEYLEEKMGGRQEKPKRFEYLYNRLANIMDEVVSRLAKEFETSSFEPVALELKIDNDGEIPPYEIALDNGGMLKIKGSIDRVDKMEKDGKSYIRVVDYKSSGKVFALADVLEGINMQMLIYLFAVWQNGEALYGDIVPAGVLYMAANAPTASLSRNAVPCEIEAEKLKKSKMNGMLLKDFDVILGMEQDGEGIFIPAKLNKGELEGTLITLEQMGKLKTKADNILCEMAKALHGGEIPALPVTDSGYKTACDYCDYKSVCGRESGMPVRVVAKLKHDEALAIIETEGGSSNDLD